jgi:hypothetical protein
MLFLLLLLPFVVKAALIDVTSTEKYATLLRTEDFIDPNTNHHVSDASIFIGIVYLVVQPQLDTTYKLQVTGMHQVSIATKISLEGPASSNAASPTPSIHVFATGPSAGTGYFQETFVVTSTVLGFLRAGQLYMQITSGGATSGQIRGQIDVRHDLMITFMSNNVGGAYAADDGMALLSLTPLSNQPGRNAVRYWILTPMTNVTGEFVLMGNLNQQLAPLGTFTPGSIKTTSIISSDAISIVQNDLFLCNPDGSIVPEAKLALQTDITLTTRLFQLFVVI